MLNWPMNSLQACCSTVCLQWYTKTWLQVQGHTFGRVNNVLWVRAELILPWTWRKTLQEFSQVGWIKKLLRTLLYPELSLGKLTCHYKLLHRWRCSYAYMNRPWLPVNCKQGFVFLLAYAKLWINANQANGQQTDEEEAKVDSEGEQGDDPSSCGGTTPSSNQPSAGGNHSREGPSLDTGSPSSSHSHHPVVQREQVTAKGGEELAQEHSVQHDIETDVMPMEDPNGKVKSCRYNTHMQSSCNCLPLAYLDNYNCLVSKHPCKHCQFAQHGYRLQWRN